jgi:hypothetical protein
MSDKLRTMNRRIFLKVIVMTTDTRESGIILRASANATAPGMVQPPIGRYSRDNHKLAPMYLFKMRPPVPRINVADVFPKSSTKLYGIMQVFVIGNRRIGYANHGRVTYSQVSTQKYPRVVFRPRGMFRVCAKSSIMMAIVEDMKKRTIPQRFSGVPLYATPMRCNSPDNVKTIAIST